MKKALVGFVAALSIGLAGCASLGVWKEGVRDRYSSVRDHYSYLKDKVGTLVDGTSIEPLARKVAIILEAADMIIVATDRIRGGECEVPEVEAVIPDACSRIDQLFTLVEDANDSIEKMIDELEAVED
ncbi:hypothetical protein LCGC14_0651670 [marine sediment metagenome]|uniref:Lipoprotein n=1 Tax=marine sediment metagenome TaxID=412755 RepID=A0A0F9QW44_9ZZZZ